MRKGGRIPLTTYYIFKIFLNLFLQKNAVKRPSPKSLAGTTHAKMKGGEGGQHRKEGDIRRTNERGGEFPLRCLEPFNRGSEGTRRKNVIAFQREINYFLRFETFLMKHFLLPSSTFLINGL